MANKDNTKGQIFKSESESKVFFKSESEFESKNKNFKIS